MNFQMREKGENFKNLETLLPFVEKPGRYIGGEINAVVKNPSSCRLHVALAFPDTYEIGMSHLGIQILYAILNQDPDMIAERTFAPWPDMETKMRAEGVPLTSLETCTPLSAFDIVGFSLQYDLSYTNVLTMLDLGGIPLRAKNRTISDPIVIAGGPCAFNPEPVAPFFDAIAVGEGEEVILEIARTIMEGKEKGGSRQKTLEALSAIEGVYVPQIHIHGEKIKKRTITNLNLWRCPERPVLPLVQAVHDRINLEIARGCTRGCRFCQAGMIWRPVREREPHILHEMAAGMLSSTGCEEISLLSLSSGDYTHIDSLLPELMDHYYGKRVAISLPSLRVESLTPRLIESIKRVRKTSFTLAPEAGTERLRKIINKGNTEADLLTTADQIFSAGWKSIKLYFMLGLPEETEEDLEGIIDLSYKVLHAGKNRKQVNVSLSTFVPKPHTPFQWHRQIDSDETLAKQDFLKKRLRSRNIVFKWHDRRMSFLEGIFSRGDRRLASVLEAAFRKGCRFDGWSDLLRFDLWEQALLEHQIDASAYLRQRTIDETMSWDHIESGPTKAFLITEYKKALCGEETRDCRQHVCHGCGACNEKRQMILATDRADRKDFLAGNYRENHSGNGEEKSSPVQELYRLRFAKGGRARFLSHLETSAALTRGIRQAGLSFIHSSGFHPHPKISFACASSVGIESRSEFVDIQVEKTDLNPEALMSNINRHLPSGLEILSLTAISSERKSLFKSILGMQYEIFLPEGMNQYPLNLFKERLEYFQAQDSFIIKKTLKGNEIERDLKALIDHLAVDKKERKIHLTIKTTASGSVKPVEIMMHLFGVDARTAKALRVIKTESVFAH